MYDYSETERASLAVEAHKKTGHSELFEACFVPDGADQDEGLAVIWRRFTPAEFAGWCDRPTTLTDTINTSMDLILSIEGATGRAIPAATNRLADLMDWPLTTILHKASRPLGGLSGDEITSLALGKKATEADAERFGLPPAVLTLRERYTDPGQLRMVKIGDLLSIVVRRPGREEWAKAFKAKLHAGTTALLVACMVHPESIEERRAVVEAWPALAPSLYGIFNEMRSRGATIEGKDGRSNSPPLAT